MAANDLSGTGTRHARYRQGRIGNALTVRRWKFFSFREGDEFAKEHSIPLAGGRYEL